MKRNHAEERFFFPMSSKTASLVRFMVARGVARKQTSALENSRGWKSGSVALRPTIRCAIPSPRHMTDGNRKSDSTTTGGG